MKDKDKGKDTSVSENRKARHEYAILETFEAGIVLVGSEVKSCRAHKVNLNEAYAAFRGGELFLQNCHISEFDKANRQNHDPLRVRKLLLHKRELVKLLGQFQASYSIIPLKMYFKSRKIKVLLGLGKGKKEFDKRADLKKKQANREIARTLRRG